MGKAGEGWLPCVSKGRKSFLEEEEKREEKKKKEKKKAQQQKLERRV